MSFAIDFQYIALYKGEGQKPKPKNQQDNYIA